jgi:GNAT superfamily N-acetyltransferase
VEVAQPSVGEAEADLDGLADVILDCIDGGASVGFLYGVTREDLKAFWRDTLAAVETGAAMLFVARDDEKLVGTVLLHPVPKPNQPHRADVSKLIVSSRARRRGVATRLMDALEAHALSLGRTLLTLDTETGSGAEQFYQRRGYVRVGDIPNYCLGNDGGPSGTTIYYKQLA